MTEFAILATGHSMSRELADSLRHLRRIVVNDAYRLAPDAEALCANDSAWWREHKEARGFAGRKFSVAAIPGLEQIKATPLIQTSSNSALLGLHVAIKVFGAKRILLYGVDMKGDHFFGKHGGQLRNTSPQRFEIFKQQFAAYAKALPADVEVLNANPASGLKCFPFVN